jgi:hypothetical protein
MKEHMHAAPPSERTVRKLQAAAVDMHAAFTYRRGDLLAHLELLHLHSARKKETTLVTFRQTTA